MVNRDAIKLIFQLALVLTLTFSCQSKQTRQYEELVKNLTIGNIQGILYKYHQDEFGQGTERTLKPLLESIQQKLTNSNELEYCINKITHYIDSIHVKYLKESSNLYEEDFYDSIFTLNKRLKNNQLDKIEKYEAINKLISFIAYQERDGTLYHYPYELRLYFQDTIYLARNNEYTFNSAVFHDHKGRGKHMNRLDRDSNYEDKLITINTYNEQKIMKERVDFKIYDEITEQYYHLFDSIIIKVIN